MKPQDELVLSFYEDVYPIKNDKTAWIVKHIETGLLYVKKEIEHFAIDVYKELQKNIYDGVPEIKHVIENEDHIIVIEQYINGRTISSKLEEGTLSPLQGLQIIINLCDILRPLHNHIPSLIHRDIKPDNILLDSEGKVWLVDFDASKMFDMSKQKDTVLLGTVGYAAPEQYGFAQSDPRTDIYQAGVLSRVVIKDNSTPDNKLNELITPIIDKCCSMDPDDRYNDVNELKAQLEKVSNLYAELKRNNSNNDLSSMTSTETDKTNPNSQTWKLPGFRSTKLQIKIIACIGYIVLIAFAFTDKNGRFTLGTVDPVSVQAAIALFATALVIGDWHGFASLLPLAKSSSTAVSIIGRMFWGIFTFVFFAFLFGLYEAL